MPKRQKSEEIKVRVTSEMKQSVLDLATARGEAESLIVREALTEYLANRADKIAEAQSHYGSSKKK